MCTLCTTRVNLGGCENIAIWTGVGQRGYKRSMTMGLPALFCKLFLIRLRIRMCTREYGLAWFLRLVNYLEQDYRSYLASLGCCRRIDMKREAGQSKQAWKRTGNSVHRHSTLPELTRRYTKARHRLHLSWWDHPPDHDR